MAQFNSDQFTNILAVPATENKTYEKQGKLRLAYAHYTTPSSNGPVATDVLGLFKLPMGAKVVSMEAIVPGSFVTSSAKIGYGTFAVDGTITVVDDDRWGSGKDLSSAGRVQFLTVAADFDYVTTAEVAAVLTFTTGNPAASKEIAVFCFYVVD